MKRILFFVPAMAVALALARSPSAAAQPALASRRLPNGIEISNATATVRVTALTDSIIRVRIGRGGQFPENASWAVPAEVRREAVPVGSTSDGFSTRSVIVHLDPGTLALRVTDLQGKTILADIDGAVQFDGRGFRLRKTLPVEQHIFG